jgi:putative membrane protein
MGDRFEIGSSRLALERAQNPEVKSFARQMVEDHTRTTQQRMELMQQMQGATGRQTSQRGTDGSPRAGAEGGAGAATSGGGTTTAQGGVQPEGLDARHQQMLAQLQAADGPQFDRLYAQMQIQAHQEAVQLFEAYAQGGEDASLRQWTQRTVPELRDHLQKAQRLHAQLGG